MKPRLKPYGDANLCGRSIERIRKAKGMTQGDLARAIGIDPANMSKLEGQIRSCKDYELVAIARELDVRLEALL